ncbi:MAG: hypothetical protein PHT96_11205 [Syntrophorhabdaceae bacterium]|nr:hypothetical protein [Syntrophorhabdaceae bacterium]MDD4196950.1 hypothetical protein [Syntrophorhabdaceae bacterium]
MFLLPVWILLTGAILVFITGSLKAGRALLSAISFLTVLSAAITLVPFPFFSQPRTFGYWGDLLLFRIEPVRCAIVLCLTVFAVVCSAWLAARYRSPRTGTVFTLLLFATGFSTASTFAANIPSVIFFTGLTFLTLLLLRKKVGD